MHNIRSTLKPCYVKRQRQWFPRGTYPRKNPETGKIERHRDFYGSGSDTRTLCQINCDRLNKALEEAASAGPLEPTFEEAVATYLGTGGDKRFLGEEEHGPRNKLLDFFVGYRVNEIDDAAMVKATAALYPRATPATINRQLYTPVISVLTLAAKGKAWKPGLTRPKGHSKLKPASSPTEDWFDLVLPVCRPQLAALIIVCTVTSRRAGEAIKCLPEHFDPATGTILIGKDKRGKALEVRLPDAAVEAILSYNWQAGPGLFGHYTHKNRRNVFRDLKLACKKAGTKYYTPHKAGRHAFAKRFLKAGHSVAHLMGAGGWDDPKTPTMLYGHYEYSEVAEDAKKVGDEFLARRFKNNVVELKRKQKR